MAPATLAIGPAVHGALVAAARAAGGHEFVAAIGGRYFGPRCEVSAFASLGNVAANNDCFAVDAANFAAAEAALRARGVAWLGFAHSHARGAPAPSAIDRRELWRDCVQLIVAGDEVRAFWFSGERCVPLPTQCPAGALQ